MGGNKIHLQGLNGIRAIAALAVVFSHIGLGLHEFGLVDKAAINLAGYGVTMFFALSGFLITYLLLVERSRFGKINIKAFYVRRILRIWPLYYLYLVLVILTTAIYSLQPLDWTLIFYALFSANVPFILGQPLGLAAHFWSLGVEEQFYAFWPWVVRGKVKLVRWITIFVCLMFAFKFLGWVIDRVFDNSALYVVIHVSRFHCMAIGALGAILFFNKSTIIAKMFFQPIVQIISWLTLGFLAFNVNILPSLIMQEYVAVITVVIILNVASNEKALIKLRSRALDFVGKISYGVYVYHPLIIFLTAKTIGPFLKVWSEQTQIILIYMIVPILTLLISYFSFQYFEKKFLDLKTRFSPIVSSS